MHRTHWSWDHVQLTQGFYNSLVSHYLSIIIAWKLMCWIQKSANHNRSHINYLIWKYVKTLSSTYCAQCKYDEHSWKYVQVMLVIIIIRSRKILTVTIKPGITKSTKCHGKIIKTISLLNWLYHFYNDQLLFRNKNKSAPLAGLVTEDILSHVKSLSACQENPKPVTDYDWHNMTKYDIPIKQASSVFMTHY